MANDKFFKPNNKITPSSFSEQRKVLNSVHQGFRGHEFDKYITNVIPVFGNTFIGLTDTPVAYVGAALDLVRVNAATNALEFVDLAAIETDPIFTAWLAVPPNISTFVNDVPYLTVEVDPVFAAWLAGPPNVSIFTNDSGYITGADVPANETDPVYSAWIAGPPNVSEFTNDSGYITGPQVPANETDPVYSAWIAGPPNVSEFTNDAGYLTAATALWTRNAVSGAIYPTTITDKALIGTVTADDSLLRIVASGTYAEMHFDTYTNTDLASQFIVRRALGTEASPLAITDAAQLGGFSMRGWDGTDWSGSAAKISAYASEDWDNTSHGTNLYFSTVKNGTINILRKAVLTNDGKFGLGTITPLYKVHTETTGESNAFLQRTDIGGFGNFFLGQRCAGTIAIPTAITQGRTLLSLEGGGYDGTSWVASGAYWRIRTKVDGGTWAVGDNPTEMVFAVMPNGKTDPNYEEILRIDENGLWFGTGINGFDVNLYRSAANTLATVDNFSILSDSMKAFYGAGSDMTIWYDGADGNIKTSDVAASDLNIDCGTEKTIKLVETVTEDLQFPISNAKVPSANFPNWETFTTNTKEYSFAADDYIDTQANELPHCWKEGTTGHVHLHITTKAANATGANRFAKFTVWVSYSDVNEVWVETSFTAEYTIPTGTLALTHLYLAMGDLTLTNYLVGSEVKCRIKRITATGGTEYSGNIFITQVGIHLENDTMGSRTELFK